MAIWCTGQLCAQVNATGTISGQVTDPSGAEVANAQVRVVEQETGMSVTRMTSPDVYYTFPLIKPAIYSIEVKAPGFATMRREDLVLEVQQVIQQDFKSRSETFDSR
jgi:hypothetical protein